MDSRLEQWQPLSQLESDLPRLDFGRQPQVSRVRSLDPLEDARCFDDCRVTLLLPVDSAGFSVRILSL